MAVSFSLGVWPLPGMYGGGQGCMAVYLGFFSPVGDGDLFPWSRVTLGYTSPPLTYQALPPGGVGGSRAYNPVGGRHVGGTPIAAWCV